MIYTFYSFKGGVGRSMALANIAEVLYRKGLKVLIVDFDLEAPGLERFFDVPDAVHSPNEIMGKRGVIDMLLSYKELRALPRPNPQKTNDLVPQSLLTLPAEPLSTFAVSIYEANPRAGVNIDPGADNPNGSLSIIPAGRREGDQFAEYAKQLRSFDWDDFYENWEGERFFELFRQQAEELADVVLIDSRTGVTEMSGVCTYQLADVVIMFVAPNEQNLNGNLMMAKSLANPKLVNEGRKGRPLSLLFVPSRVEGGESDSLDEFARMFETTLGSFVKPDIVFEKGLFLDLKIPYVQYYAYKENVAVREPERVSAAEMIGAFERLTSVLTQFASVRDQLYRVVRGVSHEAPGGAMNPQSPFYIEREPADVLAQAAMLQSGVTITIKGTRQVGKSSLLNRLMDNADKIGKRAVLLDFQQLEKEALSDANIFYRQFCSWLTDKLEMEDRVSEFWEKEMGNPMRCGSYLTRHILPGLDKPLVLAMDEVDILFDSDFRSDFFGMLRSWHNDRATRTSSVWKNLDLILVTAVEPFELIDDINQSPFNVGEIIELSDFQFAHVSELNRRYGSPFTAIEEDLLTSLLGGHPYLIHRAIYMVAVQGLPAADIFLPATHDRNPFNDHLRKIPYRLRGENGLIKALREVVHSHSCSDERDFLRLQGAGFVRREGQVIVPRCQIYSDYLQEYFNV